MQDDDDEYSLLVSLKRLYELQLSRSFPMESLYEEVAVFLQSFRNMDDEVCMLEPPPESHFVLFVLAYGIAVPAHPGCQLPASEHVFTCSVVHALHCKH